MRFPFKNYLKKIYLRYRYKVKFNGRAFISGCTFEGFNMIAEGPISRLIRIFVGLKLVVIAVLEIM